MTQRDQARTPRRAGARARAASASPRSGRAPCAAATVWTSNSASAKSSRAATSASSRPRWPNDDGPVDARDAPAARAEPLAQPRGPGARLGWARFDGAGRCGAAWHLGQGVGVRAGTEGTRHGTATAAPARAGASIVRMAASRRRREQQGRGRPVRPGLRNADSDRAEGRLALAVYVHHGAAAAPRMKSVAAMKVSSTHGSWRWPVAAHRLPVQRVGVLAAQVGGALGCRSGAGRRRATGRCWAAARAARTRRRCAPWAP